MAEIVRALLGSHARTLGAVTGMAKDPMTCQEFVASLSAYREGELGPAERTRAEEHLAGCVKCVDYLRGYEHTIELVRAAAREDKGKPEIPERLVHRVIALRRKL